MFWATVQFDLRGKHIQCPLRERQEFRSLLVLNAVKPIVTSLQDLEMSYTNDAMFVGPATTQNLVVKFDGEICGGVLVKNVSDNFPQQKKLENLLPNFAGSSPPSSPKTSPTSPWKSLVLRRLSAKKFREKRQK